MQSSLVPFSTPMSTPTQAPDCSENAPFRQDLLDAAHLQRRLHGPSTLYRSDFEFARECFPAEIVSGDFGVFYECGSSRMVVAIGDIVGKGLAAAMWSPTLLCLLRSHCSDSSDPGRVLAAINADLCHMQPDPPVTTMFMGFLDWHEKTLVYANAGHPAPLLLASDSRTRALRPGGVLLGAIPGVEFSSYELTFRPGDTLVAFTDGACELQNARGEEFGTERLGLSASRRAAGSASAMLLSLIADLQDHAASTCGRDDVTMLVVRRAE